MMIPAIVGNLSSGIMVMAETATSSGVFSGVTADTFSPITEGIKEAVPIALPVAALVWGIRKGISTLRSLIAGA